MSYSSLKGFQYEIGLFKSFF